MQQQLLQHVKNMQHKKLMIIGDLVADVYLEGKISRISREAPVLILEHQAEIVVPGGAANVIHNAVTLNGATYAVGVVGDDYAGQELERIFSEKGIYADGLQMSQERPTITKTRVMAGGQATVRQQIVRIDREKREPLADALEKRLLRYVEQQLPEMHGVVLSDYGSYTVSEQIREHVICRCRELNIPCMVDSRYQVLAYRGIHFVKQNEAEAAAAVGIAINGAEDVLKAGKLLLRQLEADAVLLTQGPDGMTMFDCQGGVTHIPVANRSEVYDVTGAGDTVVASFMLAIAGGASYLEAAHLANIAAGVVVKKPGTATASPAELEQAIREYIRS